MPLTPVDLLVFGPHPDDIEIGAGGIVALHAARGHAVGLCDLTAGELGSNGTVEERLAEAEEARGVLGASWRTNLRWPDRGLDADPGRRRVAVALIRDTRPRSVLLPYWVDRHPDHVAASRLLSDIVFDSGLRRYGDGEAWRPDRVWYYFINDAEAPSAVVDVSNHYETKRRALACHRTQFAPSGGDATATRLTSPAFRQLVESRDAQFGARAGVRFAEGLVIKEPLLLPGLL